MTKENMGESSQIAVASSAQRMSVNILPNRIAFSDSTAKNIFLSKNLINPRLVFTTDSGDNYVVV